MRINELFTRDRHNEGTRVDVKNEAGDVVGWLRVRGLDSDAYRQAHDAVNRAMVRLAAAVRAKGDGAALVAETQKDKEAATLAERAALVMDWSFEDPCNVVNVTELLAEAPYISDQIWYAANDRDRFLGNKSATSTLGPSTNSPEVSPQQLVKTEPLPTL